MEYIVNMQTVVETLGCLKTTMFEDQMSGLDEVDAFLAGETAGYKVNLPAEVDVKGIRKSLRMTQARFSSTFGFSLDAVKHWEGGRRTPESSAKAFLTVISNNHLTRSCADFPLVLGSGGENCDIPNRADQLNPAQGASNYKRLSIERGCAPTAAMPFAFQVHYARYVDPNTGTNYIG